MRIYHFGNMYMSSIQQGIQAAHAQTAMALQYGTNGPKNKTSGLWWDWANNHRTMICLNAGYDERMQEIRSVLDSQENPFPWSYFNESKAAMNGMLTNVAVVLPEKIYDTAAKIRSREYVVKRINDGARVRNVAYSEYSERNSTPGNYTKIVLSDFEIELINVLNTCGLAK